MPDQLPVNRGARHSSTVCMHVQALHTLLLYCVKCLKAELTTLLAPRPRTLTMRTSFSEICAGPEQMLHNMHLVRAQDALVHLNHRPMQVCTGLCRVWRQHQHPWLTL